MKIITYNINGIHSAINQGFIGWLKSENPDIICLQEVKSFDDFIELQIIRHLGYEIYWNAAQRKGYSGVAILSKIKAQTTYIDPQDKEGRLLLIELNDFTIISIYVPSGASNLDRHNFKMNWIENFYSQIKHIQKQHTNLIICGDYNICHKKIDIHDPAASRNTSGFLAQEREWMSKFLALGFIDAFRNFNLQPNEYTWWSYGNNKKLNIGWRIDYHLVSQPLKDRLTASYTLKNINFSDHSPVVLQLR